MRRTSGFCPCPPHHMRARVEAYAGHGLVGENGSGKSTLIEAVGRALGMGGDGGSTGSRHATRTSESVALPHPGTRDRGAASRVLPARGEHALSSTYLEENSQRVPESAFHEMPHTLVTNGESQAIRSTHSPPARRAAGRLDRDAPQHQRIPLGTSSGHPSKTDGGRPRGAGDERCSRGPSKSRPTPRVTSAPWSALTDQRRAGVTR